MKNFLFVLTFISILTLSCSNDDDESIVKTQTSINPPSWIIGTWLLFGEETKKFTIDDLILIQDNVQTSQKGLINQFQKAGQNPSVIEKITDIEYELVINYNSSQQITFRFKKTDNNNIIEYIDSTEIT